VRQTSHVTVTWCCEQMREQVELVCEQHPDADQCADKLVTFWPQFQEYGLLVHDGGSSAVTIRFCPWCGTRLPESQRGRWFDELERRGLDDPRDAPLDMRSAAWLRSR
jgi:hypothetical protein